MSARSARRRYATNGGGSSLRGYTAPHWATFKQWRELGHPVRKGEKSATVVFWKDLRPEAGPAEGDEESRPRFVVRAYHVFNCSQVEHFTPPEFIPLPEDQRITAAEAQQAVDWLRERQ